MQAIVGTEWVYLEKRTKRAGVRKGKGSGKRGGYVEWDPRKSDKEAMCEGLSQSLSRNLGTTNRGVESINGARVIADGHKREARGER